MTTRETKQQKFGKEAFVNAAENNKDQFILQVVLEDGKSYTREEQLS
ncbi:MULTISPECIES: hypothetical protein [unclassified Lysinibacillus]